MSDLSLGLKWRVWDFKCYAYGLGKLILVKFDNQLGNQIKALRSQFADAIREGMPAASAAMQVLREQVNSRWIAIGQLNTTTRSVDFDLAYDEDHLHTNKMPSLKASVISKPCHHVPLIAADLEQHFRNSHELRAFGIGHVIRYGFAEPPRRMRWLCASGG